MAPAKPGVLGGGGSPIKCYELWAGAANGLAWWMKYRGRDISERVTRAMQAILQRVPEDRYPVFWLNDHL